MFTSYLGPKAEKFLKKCEKEVYQRIKERIRELEKNPFPQEVESVKGLKGKRAFRARIGDYRIQYVVYQKKKELLVFKIDKRGRAYQ